MNEGTMRRRISRLAVLGLVAGCAIQVRAASSPEELRPGAVVEQVGVGSASEHAGLQPNDVLYAWSRGATDPGNSREAHGAIASPFDVDEAETEEAPRGLVTLTGMRGATAFSVIVRPGDWKIVARPVMSVPQLAAYDRGKALASANQLDEAIASWRAAAAQRGPSTAGVAAWLLMTAADTRANAKQWEDAHRLYQEARDAARTIEIERPDITAALGLPRAGRSTKRATPNAPERRIRMHATSGVSRRPIRWRRRREN